MHRYWDKNTKEMREIVRERKRKEERSVPDTDLKEGCWVPKPKSKPRL